MKYAGVLCLLLVGCAFEVGSSSEELSSLEGGSDNGVEQGEILVYKIPDNSVSTNENHNIYQYGCNCSIETERVRSDLVCFKTVCRGNCDNVCYNYVDFCVTDTGH